MVYWDGKIPTRDTSPEPTEITLLKEILETLQRIEALGTRKEFTVNNFTINPGTLDEKKIEDAAKKAVFWKIAQQ